MSATNDGGPAFPNAQVIMEEASDVERPVIITRQSNGGISIRDYFAAHAMTGILAMHADSCAESPNMAVVVRESYEYADAMLVERTEAQENKP